MKLLNVAKAALYGIFLHYYCYYTLRGSFIPMGTVGLLAIALVCVAMDVYRQRQVYIGTEIRCWLLYGVLAAATTFLITMNLGFLGDIFKYVQRLMIIMMVTYICEREGSARFGLRLMAVTAVACAISVMLVTDDIRLKLSISTEANLSANDVGAYMAFGCFCMLYAWGKKGQPSLVLSLLKAAGVICCLIVIFLAGSRKSLFAVLIMIALFLVLCLRDYSRSVNWRMILVVAVVGVCAYLVVTEFLLQYAEQTNLYTRLLGRGAEAAAESDDLRVELLVDALKDFVNHPLLGLGFNKYVDYHGNYTHSTYMEPLACSGLLGLLYLYPYYSMVKKQLTLIRRSTPGSLMRIKQKEMLIYLCMALFVAVGIPYMYKDIPCILLGTVIASQAISFRQLSETGTLSPDF